MASARMDYDVLVVMTELVTNAVRYAPGSVEVGLTAGPGAIVLSVTDSSDDPPRKRAADIHGGRGLIVIEQLANRWGVRFLPGGGKTVWCQFDLPALAGGRTPPESRGAVRASPKGTRAEVPVPRKRLAADMAALEQATCWMTSARSLARLTVRCRWECSVSGCPLLHWCGSLRSADPPAPPLGGSGSRGVCFA